jgi:hypothetical protein
MTRKRNAILAGVAVLAAAGLGTGVAMAATGSPARPAAAASPAAPAATASPAAYAAPGYSWYQSMMGGHYGSGGGMMGGSPAGWMMSQAGYRWMTGGAGAPGWMRGGTLPSAMMGSAGTDSGTVMGTLFANAPGPRVSAAQAQRLGSQVPAGAGVNRAARTITFTTDNVNLVVLASPSMPAESFRIAGITDPAVSVPAGARVSIELVNADDDRRSFVPRGGAVVPRQAHQRRDARRNPHLHRRHAGQLPVPVPGPRPRPGRHGRHLHRPLTRTRVSITTTHPRGSTAVALARTAFAAGARRHALCQPAEQHVRRLGELNDVL